ncbi:MAG: porin [Proteobacteria bacterium]|nr:porin [Pseudomonadota bacterium]
MQNNKPATLRRPLSLLLLAAFGTGAAAPAFAESEIDTLKRELAEQRQLIQQLMKNQEEQKKTEIQTGGPARGAGLQMGVPTGPSGTLTIYGVADVSASTVNSGYGQKSTIGSGGMSSSRIGFKGEKELGDEVKAVYLMEAGLLFDTGSVGTGAITPGINNTAVSSGGQTSNGSQIFSRQIYAGLQTRFGTLTAGRQYAGSYTSSVMSAAMGAGFFGSSAGLLPVIGGMPTRLNNSLVYASPKVAGFSGQLTLSSGSENNVNMVTPVAAGSTTVTTDKAGRGGDLALYYSAGPLNATATAWNVDNASYVAPATGPQETGLAKRRGWQVGGSYNLGFATLYGNYVAGRISGGNYENVTGTLSKADGWSVSAGIPLWRGKALVSYSQLDDKSIKNHDANLLGLGYAYKLQDSTTLYGTWGKVLNKTNGTYSLTDGGNLVGTVAKPGYDPSGYMLGVNHVF